MIPTRIREPVRLPRPRLSLLDLIVVVSAAGLALGLVRRARGVWLRFPSNLDRTAGAATMVLAVLLCVPILRQALAAWRGGASWREKGGPIAWRLAIVAVLGAVAMEQDWLLRLSPTGPWRSPMDFPPRNTDPIIGRFGVLPIVSALGLIGIVAGLTPVRGVRGPSRRGWPIRWLMVPLVAAVGLMMIALESWLPHLILLAVDGVTSSFRSSSGTPLPDVLMRGTPSLARRLDRTAWEVSAVLTLCVATGIMASRDLRRDLSAERATWKGMLPRSLLLIATALGGLRLILFTATMLHPSLYEGVALVMEPRDVAAIVGGFGLLGIGLSARAVSPRVAVTTEGGRWLRALGIAGGSLVLVLASLSTLSLATTSPGYNESTLDAGMGMLAEFNVSLGGRFPILAAIAPYLRAPLIVWALVLAWLAGAATIANLRKPGSEVAPLDGVGATWSRLAWFLWGAAAMAVLCLAALPALMLGGLVIENLRCRDGGIFG